MPDAALDELQSALRSCSLCSGMTGPPVHGTAVRSPVMLIGQAPGTREIEQGRPFCWTAGKTMFRWFESIGLDEVGFRERVYMSAVCRCFPGKNPKGGDRVPSADEVGNCARWWYGELSLLRPRLVIPVGKLAIARFMDVKRLNDVVGQVLKVDDEAAPGADLIALPHPSGLSTWFKTEPGKGLLEKALTEIGRHPAWLEVLGE